MKRLLSFFIISAAFPYALFASDSLPFPVSLGGQAAKDGTPFAKFDNPVAADAELAVPPLRTGECPQVAAKETSTRNPRLCHAKNLSRRLNQVQDAA